MKSTVIYNGMLTTDEINQIQTLTNQGYIYWIEIEKLPDDWVRWSDKNLPIYNIHEENAFGDIHDRYTQLYCLAGEFNRGTRFLGVTTYQEKDSIINQFPENIINVNPFKVQFELNTN